MKTLKWFTRNYRRNSLYEQRKAEYSVGFVLILMISTLVLTFSKWVFEGIPQLELIISIVNIIVFGLILWILYIKKLTLGVWLLNVLGVARILSVLILYDLVHYYVLVPLILIANGFIHVSKKQYHFVNGSIIIIGLYNLVNEWNNYISGYAQYEIAVISMVSIFYIFAIIYMISTFARNTDEEIRMTDELHAMATRDQLTSAYNRRRLDNELEKDMLGTNNAILMLDFDHFKQINDEYGHAVGDKVLKETIQLIKTMIRSDDMIVRFGGEEFVVILRHCETSEIPGIAEKIRSEVDSHVYQDLKKHSVTISIGGTAMKLDEGIYQAIDRADKALYRAKDNGRNTVVVI